ERPELTRRRRGRARAGAWFGPATTPPNGDTTTSPTYASSSRRTLSCASVRVWHPKVHLGRSVPLASRVIPHRHVPPTSGNRLPQFQHVSRCLRRLIAARSQRTMPRTLGTGYSPARAQAAVLTASGERVEVTIHAAPIR